VVWSDAETALVAVVAVLVGTAVATVGKVAALAALAERPVATGSRTIADGTHRLGTAHT